jgi:uncharacterized protein
MTDTLKINHLIDLIINGSSLDKIEDECHGLDLNILGSHERTPLIVASQIGNLEVVKILILNGASIYVTGYFQMTPFHVAAAMGHVEIAKYFLALGGDINVLTHQSITALMCAAAWGKVEMIKFLLESGADPTISDQNGDTAEDIAFQKSETESAKLINSYVNMTGNRGQDLNQSDHHK